MLRKQCDDDITVVITSFKETESNTDWIIVKVGNDILATCEEVHLVLRRMKSDLWLSVCELMRYSCANDLYNKELTLVTWHGSYSMNKISKVIESRYQDWLVRRMIETE